MAKIDIRGTINPNFNPVEFGGIRTHAGVQRLEDTQP